MFKNKFDSTLTGNNPKEELPAKYTDRFEDTPVFAGLIMYVKKRYAGMTKVKFSDPNANLFKILDSNDYFSACWIDVLYTSFNGYGRDVSYTVRQYSKFDRVFVTYGKDENMLEIRPGEYDTPEQVAKALEQRLDDDYEIKKFENYIKKDLKKEMEEANRKNAAAIDNIELFSVLEAAAKSYGFEWRTKQERYTEIDAIYDKLWKVKLICTDKGVKVGSCCFWPAGMLEAITSILHVNKIPMIPYGEPEKIKAIFRFVCAYIKKAAYTEWDEYTELMKYAGK